MFEKLTDLISQGDYKEALYEFQEEYFYINERTPSENAKLCLLEASIWEGLNDGTAEINALYNGLYYDFTNYEIYYMMGLYYQNINVNWAYLCMEMALKYCDVHEDIAVIESSFDVVKKMPGVRVRGTSVMILSYNGLEFLKLCIDSVESYAPDDTTEIIVVDNASTQDGVREYLLEKERSSNLKFTLVLCDENLGFPKGCNVGASYADPDNDIFFLNNDAVLMPLSLFWLRMGLYDNRDVGATSALSNSASLQKFDVHKFTEFVGIMADMTRDNNQEYIKVYEALKEDADVAWNKMVEPAFALSLFQKYVFTQKTTLVNKYISAFRLTGFALLVSRNAINDVVFDGKLFDESFSPGYFEDDDLGIRISCAGYKQYICKNSFIFHNGGDGSFGQSQTMLRGQKKFEEKWGFDIWGYCYPWLTACHEVIRLADLNKGMLKVLDFSCGFGANASYIKSIEPNVHIAGVCVNSFAAGIALNIVDEVAFGDANTTRLPWEDHSFDVIIAEKAVVSGGQIGRFLKPGGVYISDESFPL